MYLSEDEQKLIAKILEKDVKLLKPKYSPTKGFVYDIDGEIGLELSKFLSLANGLVEKTSYKESSTRKYQHARIAVLKGFYLLSSVLSVSHRIGQRVKQFSI